MSAATMTGLILLLHDRLPVISDGKHGDPGQVLREGPTGRRGGPIRYLCMARRHLRVDGWGMKMRRLDRTMLRLNGTRFLLAHPHDL